LVSTGLKTEVMIIYFFFVFVQPTGKDGKEREKSASFVNKSSRNHSFAAAAAAAAAETFKTTHDAVGNDASTLLREWDDSPYLNDAGSFKTTQPDRVGNILMPQKSLPDNLTSTPTSIPDKHQPTFKVSTL
jgi:hypothetical protein